jgi:Glycosyltransferase family 87
MRLALDPDRLTPRLFAGFVVAIVGWVLVILGSDPTISVTDPLSGSLVTAQDARSYFGLDLAHLYLGRTEWNTIGAYPYSPAFAQLIAPLDLLLPWPAFVAAWTAILIAAVYLLTGPELFLLGLAVGAMEIGGGNISLLLALAVVAGFRWPWSWSLLLLTKITPGVGLLWFAMRREWRQLGIALGATAAIVAASFVLLPAAWGDWVSLLASNSGKGGTWAAIPVPLVIRFPIAVALLVWGAPRTQRWVVPVAAMLALPALWYGSLSMLLAVIPLTTSAERARAWDRVRGWAREPREGLRRPG